MFKKFSSSYNPYFFLPFIIWVGSGGILLLTCTKQSLFTLVNSHNTYLLDVIMQPITFIGQAEVIIPALLLLFLFKSLRNWRYFILALLCNILPFFLQQALKSFFNMPRPLTYLHEAGWQIHYLADWPYLLSRSFPSGHSAGAFSFFCFLTLMLPKKYKKTGLLFFMLALSVCYSRMYLAAHFFEDVYCGSLLGCISTTLIFMVLKNTGIYQKLKLTDRE